MSETSYVELCLRALPPEKQAAARQAFHDLVDGAPGDSVLSRLLIVLEATAAYGRTIPAEISASMQAGVAALDARLAKIGTATGTKDADVAEFRAALNDQFSTFAASLPLEQNRESLDAVTLAVERVERGVRRLRHARVTAVLLLMTAAAVAGAGAVVGYFGKEYRTAQHIREPIEYLAQRGVELGLVDGGNNAVILKIAGPATAKGTDWTRDPKGRITGAQIVFP